MTEPYWVPLGSVPVDYKGNYAGATAYNPGDVVRYQGVDYLAVNPSQGSTPPTVPPTGFTGAKAVRLTNWTTANATWQYIPWDGEEFDTDAMHDNSVNPQRLVCKVAGRYAWAFNIYITVGAFTAGSGLFAFNCQKNLDTISGAAQVGADYRPMIAGIGPSIALSGAVTLAVNDWLTMMLYHNGTGTCAVQTGTGGLYPSYFAMWRIG